MIARLIPRTAHDDVRLLLDEFPAVVILGPRQVGKTTLALELTEPGAVYVDLERPSDLAKLEDPEGFLLRNLERRVVIDEVQRLPGLFAVMRFVIDEARRSGHRAGLYLLLGSASGELLRQSSESLAGRLAYHELKPIHALEFNDHETLWVRGGFPDALLASSDGASLRWRQHFITTYLERDIPMMGGAVSVTALRRLWTMLAHEQGQLHNAARLAASLGVSGPTVARYVDLLEALMLVRRLPPWSRNEGKRLVRSPKIYIRDSGIVHALLGLGSIDAVLGHPVAGGSYEGWVVENLLAAVPAGVRHSFYRTSHGAEIDLVLEFPAGGRWAIEVKRSAAPSVSRGFHLATEDVGAERRIVVFPGRAGFEMAGGIEAMTVAEAMRQIADR